MSHDLERDCLFQINVLIWALIPAAASTRTIPVLARAGLSLSGIEVPTQATPLELSRLSEAGTIAANPVIDMLLARATGRRSLVECKSDSFDVTSEQSRQARGFVAAAGAIGARLGLPNASGELSYLVPAGAETKMLQTLAKLATETERAGFPPAPVASVGLEVTATAVTLSATPAADHALAATLQSPQEVLQLQSGEDPRPLYLIAWIPDAPNPADGEEFREKVRQALLVWLGPLSIGEEHGLQYDEILSSATRGLFELWRDRPSLKGSVYPQVARICRSLIGGDAGVRLRKSDLTVSFPRVDTKDALINQIRSAELPASVETQYQVGMDLT